MWVGAAEKVFKVKGQGHRDSKCTFPAEGLLNFWPGFVQILEKYGKSWNLMQTWLCECTQCIGLALLLYVCLYVYVVIQPLAAKPNKSINQIFKALKSLENDHSSGWKGLEKSSKTVMLTWKIQISVTLLITDAFVNFLAVYDTKHVSEVQSSKIWVPFGIWSRRIHCIGNFGV